jgi:hypothetical protein
MGHRNPEAIALPVRIVAERRILHRKPVFQLSFVTSYLSKTKQKELV